MPAATKTVNQLLKDKFHARHVDSAVQHFLRMVEDFQRGDWEDATAKGGKFVEAVLKVLWVHVGETVPTGRHFSAGSVMDCLPSKSTFSDAVRLTIPRACRFAYDIASNRGARHDATEIDASEMDASVVFSVCAWVLSEMVRYSQKGLDLAQAKSIVDRLMKRRFPFFEEIEGRIYTDLGNSAKEVALLILFRIYPKRMSHSDLVVSVMRHEYTQANAEMAVRRLSQYIDYDDDGDLRLRNTGLREAEKLTYEATIT